MLNNSIFKLAKYLESRDPRLRSFHFRHKNLLLQKLRNLKFQNWPLNEKEEEVAKKLMQCCFANEKDFADASERRVLKKWKLFPRDRNFYKMLISQQKLWFESSELTLDEFLKSPAAKKWVSSRERLQRPALFPLDQCFKSASRGVLENERRVLNLLRKHPLLRYQDLKKMRIPNAQKIIENFSALEMHREKLLEKLRLRF